jgi:hypothetical protein
MVGGLSAGIEALDVVLAHANEASVPNSTATDLDIIIWKPQSRRRG